LRRDCAGCLRQEADHIRARNSAPDWASHPINE
jgi:hypothetical protein